MAVTVGATRRSNAISAGRLSGPVWARLTLAAVSFALLLGAMPGPVGGFTIIVATAAYGVALARLGWEIGAP